MKNTLFFTLVALFTAGLQAQSDNARHVNPFIGTGAVDANSLSGSNFPGACFPFGLVQLSPDTKAFPWDPCSGYDYNYDIISGFSHTHLSGTGVPDLFDFLFMPYGGKIQWEMGDEKSAYGYRSRFRHQTESAKPGYYSVTLDDYNIGVELAATEHCGMHRYTFADNQPYNLMIDLDYSLARDSRKPTYLATQIRVVDNKTIEGYRILTGWAPMRKVYFRAEFSRPFTSTVVKSKRGEFVNNPVTNANPMKMNVVFTENNTAPLIIKVGISSVSPEGARKNLKAEIKDFNFDKTAAETYQAWNKELACIDIQATEKQKRIFYTGLYHAFIQPNNIADANGEYMDTNFNLRKSADEKYYSTFSLWDTYRAAHPLYTLVQEKRTESFIHSMLRQYETYGYLPIWHLWGMENYCMIGNHAIPVVVDAFFKGIIQGDDRQKAYEAVKASSVNAHVNFNPALLDKYGYFPEDKQTQSVSITLEVAFNDWCTAQMAKSLGKEADYRYFIKRSEAYKALFDHNIGFFRGKDSSGKWIEPFNPLTYGGNGGYPFTEGNAWQYLWYVPQDVPAFMALFGGIDNFTKKLDTFFTLNAKPEDVNGNASGFIGQYAHGNEPSHQVAYLYNFTNEPWKAQMYAAKIMNELYNDDHSGYSGNEDCGQMSAWYIFSAMGFYPVNPSNSVYCFGSPLLEKAVIHIANGKNFIINVKNAGNRNIYIQKIALNGKPYHKLYITHQEIISGGTLEFTMGNKPNTQLAKYEKPISLSL